MSFTAPAHVAAALLLVLASPRRRRARRRRRWFYPLARLVALNVPTSRPSYRDDDADEKPQFPLSTTQRSFWSRPRKRAFIVAAAVSIAFIAIYIVFFPSQAKDEPTDKNKDVEAVEKPKDHETVVNEAQPSNKYSPYVVGPPTDSLYGACIVRPSSLYPSLMSLINRQPPR